MPSCVLRYCKNTSRNSNKSQGLTFHKFPRPGTEYRESWIKFVQNDRSEKTWLPSDHAHICSVHFKTEHKYTTKTGRVYLKKNAIPCDHPSTSKPEPVLHEIKNDEFVVSDDDMPSTSELAPVLNEIKKEEFVVSDDDLLLADDMPSTSEPAPVLNEIKKEEFVVSDDDLLLADDMPVLYEIKNEEFVVSDDDLLQADDMPSTSEPAPVLYEIKKEEFVVSDDDLPLADDMPSTSKKPFPNIEVKINRPKEELNSSGSAPLGAADSNLQIQPQCRRVQNLASICYKQRNEIKRLKGKIKRQAINIATLVQILKGLDEKMIS